MRRGGQVEGIYPPPGPQCCWTPTAPQLRYAADMLSQYFGDKLTAFSQAANKSGSTDGEEEDGTGGEAMDVSRGAQPVEAVMGQAWAQQLQHILAYLQQLGLQVSLEHLKQWISHRP